MTAPLLLAANFAALQPAVPATGSVLPFVAPRGDIVAGIQVAGFENLVQLLLLGESDPLPLASPSVAAGPMATVTQPPMITSMPASEQEHDEDEESPAAGMLSAAPALVPDPTPQCVEIPNTPAHCAVSCEQATAAQTRPMSVGVSAVPEEAAPVAQAEQQDAEQPRVAPQVTQETPDPGKGQVRVVSNNLSDKASKGLPVVRLGVGTEGARNNEVPSNEAFTLELRSTTGAAGIGPDHAPRSPKASVQDANLLPASECDARKPSVRVAAEPSKWNDSGASHQDHRQTAGSQPAPPQAETAKTAPASVRANTAPSAVTAEPANRSQDVPPQPNTIVIPSPDSSDHPQPNSQQPATAAPASPSTVQQIEALRLAGVQLGFRPQQPVQNLELRVPAANGPVDVRLIDHGGRIEIAVRSADAGLAQDLRQQLPELVDRLDSHGYSFSGTERARTEPVESTELAHRQGQESTYSDQRSSQQQQQQRRERNSAAARHAAGDGNKTHTDFAAFRIEPGDFQTGAI